MTAMSHRAMRRVVCRIFIKASPRAVWDAICPALNQSDGYVSLAGTGAAPAAAPPPVRSGLVYFELRDTLTGYTAVTVSCASADGFESGSVGAHEWDRLLGDLKIVLEYEGRERQRTGSARSSPRRPPGLRPKLVPQVQALSGGRLSPDRPAPALPGGAVRMSRDRSRAVPGERESRAVPGERESWAAPGEREPSACQCAEGGDRDSDSGDRGAGIRGVIQGAGNVTTSRGRPRRSA
jgi:hypothetical protein